MYTRVLLPSAILAALLLSTNVSCTSTGQCPSIACQPRISVSYNTLISSSYSLSVSLGVQEFTAVCPTGGGSTGGSSGGSGLTCSDSGFTLAGVDLGHGSNTTVDLDVKINNESPSTVRAALDGIENSRDCELVCFRHTGTLQN